MNPIAINILWVFSALLVAGGLVGFLKANSKASLIASVLCAIPLVLVAARILPPVVAVVALGLIFVIFVKRFAKSKSFMPSGMLMVLSLLAEAAMVWFLYLAPKA